MPGLEITARWCADGINAADASSTDDHLVTEREQLNLLGGRSLSPAVGMQRIMAIGHNAKTFVGNSE